jgi:mRNA interferase MazF
LVPDEADIVWIRLDAQAGRGQAGHRPAVVLTPAAYNSKSGLLLCVPLTTQAKGYPFEVPMAGDRPSVALVDHVKSLDWRARAAKQKGRATAAEMEEIRVKLRALVG